MSKYAGYATPWSEEFMARITKSQKFRQQSFGFLVQLLARRLDARMKARLSDLETDLKAFATLMLLSEKDGINQRQLGRLLDFPEYATSRNVDALVAQGLAQRLPDPNSRRSFHVHLTPAGREKAKRLPEVVRATNSEFLNELSKTERKQLVDLLQKVAGIPKAGDPEL
ncbi:MAG: MarR family transcriptional regulator [bacterium]|nr:MarR family transcriptional regulator [bacterium]